MSSNIESFELGIEREKEEALEQFDRRRRATMLAAAHGVVFATPVGNPDLWQNPDLAPPGYVGGQARRNWQLTIEGGAPDVTEETDQSGSTTLAEIEAGIARTKGDAFSRYDLVNGLDYIVPLEEGHSMQAPNGMVAVTVARLRRSGLVT